MLDVVASIFPGLAAYSPLLVRGGERGYSRDNEASWIRPPPIYWLFLPALRACPFGYLLVKKGGFQSKWNIRVPL